MRTSRLPPSPTSSRSRPRPPLKLHFGLGLTGFLAATLLAACDRAGSGDSRSALDVPRWTARQETRIGSVDDPDQSLTGVTSVHFGPAGEVVIAQPQDRTVRVFASDGLYLRAIGRRGEGPGEFGVVSSMGVTGDSLWVGDNALGRLTWFDLGGSLLRTTKWSITSTLTAWGAYRRTVPVVLLPDGTGIMERAMLMRLAIGATPPEDRPGVPIIRADSTSEGADTLAIRNLETRDFAPVTVGGREYNLFWTDDDVPVYRIAADGSGIMIVERRRAPDTAPSSFTVHRIGIEGDTVYSRRYPYVPVAVGDAHVKAVAAELAERYGRAEELITAALVEQTIRSAGVVPATMSPVTDVATGTDGTVWIQLASRNTDVATWLVLDAEGEPIGSIDLPAASQVVTADGDRIATLELDALDVPYVVIYRVTR